MDAKAEESLTAVDAEAATPPKPAKPAAFDPLKRPMFRALWIANLVSSMGTWMHDVGAGWLMTTLAPDPFMVSLVQTAVVLPAFFLALPAGALADIVDRRTYMIGALLWMLGVAGGLGFMTLAELTTAWVLLGFTFCLGVGVAMLMPAFAALVPDLVPRQELTAAITLNSIAMNLTRAVGPAVAGALVAWQGPGLVFVLNALSYSGLLYVMFRYRSEQPRSTLPSERFFGALRVGLGFAKQAPRLQIVLLRALAFFIMMSGMWAFIPLIVRQEVGAGPELYGFMLGSMGAGAVVTGLSLTQIRNRFSPDVIVGLGTLVAAGVLLGLAYLRIPVLLCLVMFVGGGAWIGVLSTLQVSAQMALPAWVRARGLAIYVTVFMGTTAIGAAMWGRLAASTSITAALLTAAGVGLIALAITLRLRLSDVEAEGLEMAQPLPDPELAMPMEPNEGPVMVTVEYDIETDKAKAFQEAMRDVRRMRLRNGAMGWSLFQDAAVPSRFVESFIEESWLAHLRQHERQTIEDMAFREVAEAFHRGSEPPRVSHLIARRAPRRRKTMLKQGAR